MIKVCFVRGKYLNNFEGQNYLFNTKDIQLTAVSSFFPLHRSFPFLVKKYISPVDFPFFAREIKYFGNRLIGDAQILFGLEGIADKFDIFHTADPHYYYSYQLAKLRQKNLIKKLIVTAWETIPFNNESVKRKKYIKYFTLKQADHFICYTEKAKKALVLEGVNPKKISVVWLGVDLKKFKFQKSKFKVEKKETDFTILFVGRLVEEKGILDLYGAFKQIKNEKLKMKNYKLKLKIIGDGLLKPFLKSLITKDELSSDVFIEKKSYEEMPKIYRESDIFVLPSKRTKTWEEQYGMALVEAMASGLPIVAYNSGTISEIIEEAGILVKEGDLKNLIASIKQLIKAEKLRTKLGKIGRERAEKEFDAKKTANYIKNIYFKIAAIPRN